MGSKQLGADVNLAWPTARIALIGAGADEDVRASPHDAAARGFIDAVIEPGATRSAIARALAALRGKARGDIPL